MLEKLSITITRLLCSNLVIADEQYEACRYGCEALLHTVLSTMGLLIIGLLSHRILETLLIVAVFYVNQTLGGGYHAISHFKCFLTMAISLLLGLLLCGLPLQEWIYFIFSCVALIVLARIPLILHENKKYLAARKKHFIKRSRTMIIVWFFAAIICLAIHSSAIRPLTVGLMFSAISRFMAKYQANL